VLLKSNRSHRLAGFTVHLSTDSNELGNIFAASDSAVTGSSEVPTCLKSNRSQTLAGLTSHLSTDSSELSKTYPGPSSAGEGANDIPKVPEFDRLQRIAGLTSQFTTELDHGITGAVGTSKFLESQRLESSVGQNIMESEKSSRVTSQCGGRESIIAPFLSTSSKSQSILGIVSQNEVRSHESGKAFVYNYGEMETKCVPALITPKQLQNHGNYLQKYETDRAHLVVAGTSGTETSKLFKSNIPRSVAKYKNKGMRKYEEDGNSLSCAAELKQCCGMLSQSYPLGEEATSKLDARESEEHVFNTKESRLSSSVERTITPMPLSCANPCMFTRFTNPEVTNKQAVNESEEHDNISAYDTGKITAECFWPRPSQPPRFSARSTVATHSKRKRSTEESIDRYISAASKGPLEQGSDEVDSGECDEVLTKSSLLCNITASRHLEKSSESNVLGEVMSPSSKKIYTELDIASECASSWMTCNDEVPTDKLAYLSEQKVSLERKSHSISANETNSMQNSSTENSTTQNPSVFVFQRNELPESSKMVSYGTEPDQAFTFANQSAFAVSIATQTDSIVKKNTTVQTDSLICVKSAIEKLFILFESQEVEINCLLKQQEQLATLCKKQGENIQAIQKQTNVMCNEMVNIINMFSSKQENKFGKRNKYSFDVRPSCNYKDSEMSSSHLVSRTPLRRSARIAAQASGTITGNCMFYESKSVPVTPALLKSHEDIDYPGLQSLERCATMKLNKSSTVYKELCSSFRFLKTPQSSKWLHTRTPKNTPTRILSRRLQDQVLSLYD